MVGFGAWAVAVFGVALTTSCGGQPPAPARTVVKPASAAEPVYRYVSLGVGGRGNQLALGGGRIGVIADDGGREIVEPDGSLQVADSRPSDRLMGGVPIPARLGGGFLFWQNALYRARSFAGPLETIVEQGTNVVGVEFGPDYLLVLTPGFSPRAFALDPLGARPLSPHGVIDVAATDDGRALSFDATGRALASTDAGKSWQDVSSAVGAVYAVREERNEVAFLARHSGAWLQRDGQFIQRPLVAAARAPRPERTAELLRQAFVDGLALPGSRAWVGEGGGTAVVDLRTGSASPAAAWGPKESRCQPVSLDDEGVAVCVGNGAPETVTVFSHALGTAPVLEKTFAGSPQFMAGRTLSVIASCSGAPARDSACVRRSGGAWTELRVSRELRKAWQPLFWVPRESGGVCVVVRDRDLSNREPVVALLDPAANRATLWDATPEQVTPNSQPTAPRTSYLVLADGSVRGYTSTRTIAVDPQGHVALGAQSFVTIASAGAHALARDSAEHLWQTSDYGAHWLDVARPPFDDVAEGAAAKLNPRPSGRASRIDCSLSGCALEHSSGTGIWLRLGWPEDLAREPAAADTAANQKGSLVPPRLPEPALPKLRCLSRTGVPLHATIPPPRPPEPKASGEWINVLAGRRALASRPPRTFANIGYRDLFSAENEYVHFGLRAALHLEADQETSIEQLIAKKTPLNLLFVEPFEPNGSVRQLTATLKDWSSSDRSSGSDDARIDFDEGAARPVLSSDAGHAGGVLLVNGPLSVWAPNRGKVQPFRQGCTPVSGYVDARGKRFVACRDRNGATRIEDLATPPRVVVRAPAAAHGRDPDNPGLQYFPPGEPVFLNPDAIAVGRDGKLRILRLPPGEAPPTIDNPAWLLSADAAPVELAPWSTLEAATSSACAAGDGYRAIVQSGSSWLDVAGASAGARTAGMTALVRWSAERVCLEAVEVAFSEVSSPASLLIHASAVARFVGVGPGAAFVGTGTSAAVRETATCELTGL